MIFGEYQDMKNHPDDSDFESSGPAGLGLLDILAEAKTIYNDLLIEGEKRLNELIDEAGNLDPKGKAKPKTVTARQALRNPTLNTTNVHTARKTADKALADSIASTMPALRKILPELVSLLQASLVQNLLREADTSIENKSRKRKAPMFGASQEEMMLLQKLRHAGVPPSAFDLLNAEEIQLVADLLKIKTKTARHELPLPTTLALIAAGPDIIKVGTMPEDEADAIRGWMRLIKEEGIEARRYLEKAAGRPLKISDSFAASLVQLPNSLMNATDEAPVLDNNADTAMFVRREADIKMIMQLLGVPDDDKSRERAEAILDPAGGFSEQSRAINLPATSTKSTTEPGPELRSNASATQSEITNSKPEQRRKLDAEEAPRVAKKIFDEGYFKNNYLQILLFAAEGKTDRDAVKFLESIEPPLANAPLLKKLIQLINDEGWAAADRYYTAETIRGLEAGLRLGRRDLIDVAKYLGYID